MITDTILTIISPVGDGNTGDSFQLSALVGIPPRRLVTTSVSTAVVGVIIISIPIHGSVRQSTPADGALPSDRV